MPKYTAKARIKNSDNEEFHDIPFVDKATSQQIIEAASMADALAQAIPNLKDPFFVGNQKYTIMSILFKRIQ